MRFQLSCLLSFPLVAIAAANEQIPIGQTDMSEPYTPLTTSQPTLADLLTIEPSASIFYSYAREVELSEEFSNLSSRNTLLVPTNKAIMALTRKPHQDPASEDAISEEEFDARSKKNVERWVSAHIIPSPIALSTGTYPTLLEGKPVAVDVVDTNPNAPEWSRVILNGGIHILSSKEAINGGLYMIDDTIKID